MEYIRLTDSEVGQAGEGQSCQPVMSSNFLSS
jgi:hypothetical protein